MAAREYCVDSQVKRLSLTLSWQSGSDDISFFVLAYDEGAEIVRRFHSNNNNNSNSGNSSALANNNADATFVSIVNDSLGHRLVIDLPKAAEVVSLVLVVQEKKVYNDNDLLVATLRDASDYGAGAVLLERRKRMRNEFKQLLAFALFHRRHRHYSDSDSGSDTIEHRQGEVATESMVWVLHSLYQPVLSFAVHQSDEECWRAVVGAVPLYAKFRRRQFNDIGEVCTALTTRNLLFFKTYFEKAAEGLALRQFTEVLFLALSAPFPLLLETEEAHTAVALLDELFHQIDFNQNGLVSWAEFCDFCVAFSSLSQTRSRSEASELNEAVVVFEEDPALRDAVLAPSLSAASMRFHPGTRRFVVVQEHTSEVAVLDERFKLVARMRPKDILTDEFDTSSAARSGGGNSALPKRGHRALSSSSVSASGGAAAAAAAAAMRRNATQRRSLSCDIFDALYIQEESALLLVFCADNYEITVLRERSIMEGRKPPVFKLQHKIQHTLVHHRLCWCASARLLCSVASNFLIYGWRLDSVVPEFQLMRHTDAITAMVCVDAADLFVTSGLDKRVVLWSATNQRVKGILEGHRGGVRCVHATNRHVVSGSFDCTARVWDLVTKECRAVLEGHRTSVCAALLVGDEEQGGLDARVFTADELGEVRMYAAFRAERSLLAPVLAALQVFHMVSPVVPISRIRFLVALRNNTTTNTSSSSTAPVNGNKQQLQRGACERLVACGSKLLVFEPRRRSRDFTPATCAVHVPQISLLVTAVGGALVYYDLGAGRLKHLRRDVWPADLTALCLSEASRSRLLFMGTADGAVVAYCFRSGMAVDHVRLFDKEVTCLALYHRARHFVAAGNAEGSLRLVEEAASKLTVTPYAVAPVSAFGRGVGIAEIHLVEDFAAAIVTSSGRQWGLWCLFASSLAMVHAEEASITGARLLGHNAYVANDLPSKLITFCVAMAHVVHVYTIDIYSNTIAVSFVLEQPGVLQIRCLAALTFTGDAYKNYECYAAAEDRGKVGVAGCCEDGSVVCWQVADLVARSEQQYRAGRAGGGAGGVGTGRGSQAGGGVPVELAHVTAVVAVEENAQETRMRLRRCSLTVHVRAALSVRVAAQRVFRAHLDAVGAAVALPESACLVTVAADGYQRLWNLEGACLGECLLPNVSQDMQARKLPVYRSSKWLFRTEALGLTDEQREVAAALVGKAALFEGDLEGNFEVVSFEKLLAAEAGAGGCPPEVHFASTRTRSAAALSRQELRSKVLGEILVDAPDDELSLLSSIALVPPERTLPSSLDRLPVILPLQQASPTRPSTSTTAVAAASTSLSMASRDGSHPQQASSSYLPSPLKVPAAVPGNSSERPHTTSSSSPLGGRRPPPPSSPAVALLWQVSRPATAAFSEASLKTGAASGVLDAESFHTLQAFAARNTGYRSGERLLLRSPEVAARALRVPSARDASVAELSFGSQKHLYKHANAVIARGDRRGAGLCQHKIAMARIGRDVRLARANKMVLQVDATRAADDRGLFLQERTVADELAAEQERSDARRLASSSRLTAEQAAARRGALLDVQAVREGIQQCAGSTEREIRCEVFSDYHTLKLKPDAKKSAHKVTLDDSKTGLEKKLQNAILAYFAERGDIRIKSERAPAKKLTTRDLLPYYTLGSVRHFLDIFSATDADCNGALDMKEWISIFTALDSALPLHEIIGMFDGADSRMEGLLVLSDMVPMIFNKASREQRRLIQHHCESVVFSSTSYSKHLKAGDLQRLFECYDSGCVGFVPVPEIKERLQAMQFSPEVVSHIIDQFLGISNDEYLNLPDFVKLFRVYMQTPTQTKTKAQTPTTSQTSSTSAALHQKENKTKPTTSTYTATKLTNFNTSSNNEAMKTATGTK